MMKVRRELGKLGRNMRVLISSSFILCLYFNLPDIGTLFIIYYYHNVHVYAISILYLRVNFKNIFIMLKMFFKKFSKILISLHLLSSITFK